MQEYRQGTHDGYSISERSRHQPDIKLILYGTLRVHSIEIQTLNSLQHFKRTQSRLPYRIEKSLHKKLIRPQQIAGLSVNADISIETKKSKKTDSPSAKYHIIFKNQKRITLAIDKNTGRHNQTYLG